MARPDSVAASIFSCPMRVNSSRSLALGVVPADAMRAVRWEMTCAEATHISPTVHARSVQARSGLPIVLRALRFNVVLARRKRSSVPRSAGQTGGHPERLTQNRVVGVPIGLITATGSSLESAPIEHRDIAAAVVDELLLLQRACRLGHS